MKRAVVLAALLAASAAHGADIANGYKCVAGVSPEHLVRSLIKKGVIADKPYYNEDAVKHFAAAPGFEAFGLPLVAVVGWQDGSEFFGRGPGTAPPVHFAFVVQASLKQLAQAVGKQGIDVAGPREFNRYPRVMVKPFGSKLGGTLPPEADSAATYSLVGCYPKP